MPEKSVLKQSEKWLWFNWGIHITSLPENKLELKAVLKGLSSLWSQIMWLGLCNLSHKQYTEVSCYGKRNLKCFLSWHAVQTFLYRSPLSSHHKFWDTSSARETQSTGGPETKSREGGKGCWLLTRKSTGDCRSQPWGTPTKKVIKNKGWQNKVRKTIGGENGAN